MLKLLPCIIIILGLTVFMMPVKHYVRGSVETSTSPTAANPLLGLMGPMMKSIADQVEKSNPILKMIVPKEIITPTTTTSTTTSTTTLSPIEDLTKTMISIPAMIPGSHLITEPAKAINSALSGSIVGAVPLNGAAEHLVEATKVTGQILGTLTGIQTKAKPEDESSYYELQDGEPLAQRRPKYFSRECNFRVACEVGKMSRLVPAPGIDKTFESNKLVQDLQNRYTRAMTYGLLHGDCERYYCLITRLMGGPKQFTGAVVELVNRVANPELYDSELV